MEQITEIIHDLSIKYLFNNEEALKYISEKYFKNEYSELIQKYPIENIIEALKIRAGIDRKKHIFSKMRDWNTNEFVKYITHQCISVTELNELLVQSVESIKAIKTEKIKHKEKRANHLLKYIEELQVGDIVDRYIVVEKCDTFAKCVYIQYFKFSSKTQEIQIHLGCDFKSDNYIKTPSYSYLRNRDPYIARQSWYKLRFYVEVENVHKYMKSFMVGILNETDRRNSELLYTLFSGISYPSPEDYPENFNDLPNFLKKEEEDINKLCDILGLDYKDKNNIEIIKKQYKKKALQLHPDKNTGNTTILFQELNNAYSKLLNINENDLK